MSKSLEKRITDICVFLHTELSSMERDFDEPTTELCEILRLNPFKALELITKNIEELLKIKRTFLEMDGYKNCKDNYQYQKALQKLESEVRNHIKIEQQMKLHIDSTQAKLEELEKLKNDPSLQSAFDSLKKENIRLMEKIRSLEKQSENSEEKTKFIKEINLLKTVAQKDSAKNMELEKNNRKLELEVKLLQKKLEIIGKDIHIDRSSAKENRPDSTKKMVYEEKTDNLLKMLTNRTRNYSRQDLRKSTSKSPILSKPEMKRTESQLIASNRYKMINGRKRKNTYSINFNAHMH